MIQNPYKLARLLSGKSQKKVEKLTGIPQPKISLIERGLPPRPDEAKKLSKLYGLQDGQTKTANI